MKPGTAFAISVGLALTLIAAPGAGAGVRTAKKSVDVPKEQGVNVSATAACPAGSEVLSGGWHTTEGVIGIFESRRVGARSWRVSGVRFTNDLDPAKLIAYAYCDTKAERSTEAVGDANIAVDDTDAADANCGDGKQQAGGFEIEDFSQPQRSGEILANELVAGNWLAKFINPGIDPIDVHAYAYCMHRAVKRVATRAKTTTAELFKTRKCPKGKMPISASFRIPNPGNSDSLVVRTFRRVGRSWQINADDADEVPHSTTLKAFCSKP